MAVEYPNPNTLNPDRMLQIAEDYLASGDLGAARFYGNFAVAIGSFDQQLVDAKSIIAPDATKTKQYLVRAQEVVKSAISSPSELETRVEEHADIFDGLKKQFGTEYSF